MQASRVTFPNESGQELSALLALPASGHPLACALFAHCFTCGKDSRAATEISRHLTQAGFAVLRFDFTGLGESEGEFSQTSFTTNLGDLRAAARYLADHLHPPSLLIGHSLGGTAVLHVAHDLDSVKAVCTIGAPMEASHVLGLMRSSRDEILSQGKATVDIGGRPICIGAKFIADLEQHRTAQLLPKLRKALLILHSPIDEIVSIDNAAAIYQAALHPKSFVSLDGANHLLSRPQDAAYAASMMATWARRYLSPESRAPEAAPDEVIVQLGGPHFTSEIIVGPHHLWADEPKEVGGDDLGPSPYQLLCAALGACTTMTLRMYATRKNWPLDSVTVRLIHEKRQSETPGQYVDFFSRKIALRGGLDSVQCQRLLEIANRCPVHRTLTGSRIQVESKLD